MTDLIALLKEARDEADYEDFALPFNLRCRITNAIAAFEVEPEAIGEIYDFNLATGLPVARFNNGWSAALTIKGLPYKLYARPVLETEPDRKCGTCKHWAITRDNPSFGDCSQLDDIGTHEHFFCAYWQARGETK